MVQRDVIVRTDEQHEGRSAGQEIRKVVCPARPEAIVHGEARAPHPWPAGGRQRRLVDQRGLALGDRYLALAAVPAAGVRDDLAHRLVQAGPVGRVERAQ
jgi:hypothetical protein